MTATLFGELTADGQDVILIGQGNAARRENSRQKSRRWAAAHPDRIREKNRRWEKANRERINAQRRARRAASRKSLPDLPACSVCGTPTSSKYGICSRPACASARLRAERVAANPGRTHVNCSVCGKLTYGQNGVCRKTKACRAAWTRARKLDNPALYMLQAARTRARTRGIPFNLQENDIVIPEFCPVLGIKLERGSVFGGHPASPSLDRIIPERGYVTGNIQIISAQANSMKRDATPEQLRRFCEYYLQALENL